LLALSAQGVFVAAAMNLLARFAPGDGLSDPLDTLTHLVGRGVADAAMDFERDIAIGSGGACGADGFHRDNSPYALWCSEEKLLVTKLQTPSV
jgi:hypothetical protein